MVNVIPDKMLNSANNPMDAMPQGVNVTPFTLTKRAKGVSFMSADIAAGSDWEEVMRYDVPVGVMVQILAGNYIFGDYKTAADEAIKTGSTRLVKENSTGRESVVVWEASNSIFGDLGDAAKRPVMNVQVSLRTAETLKVECCDTGAIVDKTKSNFEIQAVQFSSSL